MSTPATDFIIKSPPIVTMSPDAPSTLNTSNGVPELLNTDISPERLKIKSSASILSVKMFNHRLALTPVDPNEEALSVSGNISVFIPPVIDIESDAALPRVTFPNAEKLPSICVLPNPISVVLVTPAIFKLPVIVTSPRVAPAPPGTK